MSPPLETLGLPPSSLPETLTFDELENPHVRLGANYWLARRGERRFPSRKDLNPRDFAAALPYMSLVKVIDGGADFEHRIVGDHCVKALRIPAQNRRFKEIELVAPKLIAISRPFFERVVQTRLPVVSRTRSDFTRPDVNFTHIDTVFLPLGDSDDAVDHILTFSSFYRRID
jgi:hypothetical protein